MKIKMLCLAIATAVAVPSLAVAGPGEGGKKAAPAPAKLNDADQGMLAHRHHVNVMEIEMGKLAQQRGTAGSKKYGAMLVKDHSASDKNVRALAKERGVTLSDHPTPTTPAEQEDHKKSMDRMERLKSMEGEAFDREFLPAMVEGHEKEHARVSGEVGVVADAKLKALLEKTLPTLRKHADEARSLQGAIATGPTPPSSPTPPTNPSPTPTPPSMPTPKPTPKPAPGEPAPKPGEPAPKPAPPTPTPAPSPPAPKPADPSPIKPPPSKPTPGPQTSTPRPPPDLITILK